jgi:L-alanine-DL-glutamate epimerase-like enolase superfamily enzyme
MSMRNAVSEARASAWQNGRIERLAARAYRIPTDKPEADGTLAWSATTLVVVEAEAAGTAGLGYTYSDASIVDLIAGRLFEVVKNVDAVDPPAAWRAMNVAIRNMGRSGLVATAISAVDIALWDLKARLLDQPLAILFGRSRESVPIYGSGGFTSYTETELCAQLSRWVEVDGCHSVKMKIGSRPDQDPQRVRVAKSVIGDHSLFVDANGAYDVKQALVLADRFVDDADVRWFEEPVSSDDLAGLAYVREHAPANLDIAAGEYGFDIDYFRQMISAEAIDVQQADVTRCGGYTGFLQVAALCEAHHMPLSAHCAPALHLPAACTAPRLRHLEWFHDHVRIEHMLFEGAPDPRNGSIEPDLSRPGHGLTFKSKDAAHYQVA